MPAYNDDHIITLKVTGNPKNPRNGATNKPAKAAQRFALYKNGMSVAQYKAAVMAPENAAFGGKGYAAADIIWDTQHGYISVTAPGKAAAPAAAPAKAETAPAAKSAPAKRQRKAAK